MNKISLIGLLGFLGFLGIYTGSYEYFGFFGFFVFFAYAGVKYDELFAEYLRKSAAAGFFTSVALFGVSVASTVLLNLKEYLPLILIGVFTVSMIVFILRLTIFQFAESAGEGC
ncbi:MAG: DUF3796 domain-containing protein [Methanocorpusculum sp.]|nr:DUF3796 domain-containing protein [Methanocorpusculum sp.]